MNLRTSLPLLLLAACSAPSDPRPVVLPPAGERVTDRLPGVYQSYYRIVIDDASSLTVDPEGWARAGAFTDSPAQRFAIVPAAPDGGAFYVVPMSGGILEVGLSGAFVGTWNGYPTGKATQLFWLSDVAGDVAGPERQLQLRSEDGGRAIGWADGSTSLPLRAGGVAGGARFTFVPVADFPYPMPIARSGAIPGEIGDVPRITSYSSTPPLASPPQLIGEVTIPFVYVDEGVRGYEAQQSPYYRLVREQLWRRMVLAERPAGLVDTGGQWTLTVGMYRDEAVVMERSLGAFVDANGEWAFREEWLKDALGPTMEQQLKVATKLAATTQYPERTDVWRETALPVDEHLRWAVWCLVDRYSLFRMDGSQVNAWELVDLDSTKEVVDIYFE